MQRAIYISPFSIPSNQFRPIHFLSSNSDIHLGPAMKEYLTYLLNFVINKQGKPN